MTGLALWIVPAELGDNVAELRGNTLKLDPSSAFEDQLAAVADAVQFLQTGRPVWGRWRRHLAVVST
ncbi:hypothetical protein [Pseudonocardia dioxanivorans]|uniref:hypothetical protein n=1 Tax=Pseudonocardia dioxanivorans TaxID=240495 RepID=UPI000CD1E324|nr:hypothetical protein [Pseudonocardia dioxanivorans]